MVLCLAVTMMGNTLMSNAQSKNPYNIVYKNVESEAIRDAFMKVVSRYPSLKNYKIILKQQKIKSSTMQAQPVVGFKSLFHGIKRYRIKLAMYVRDSDEILVSSLPENVLVGWFAHELGHVVDYQPYTSWQMIKYGVKYVMSRKFRKTAEYSADYIAIANGFHEEIIEAKRYILENDFVNEEYKAKIQEYYMSIEDVILCSEGQIPMGPTTQIMMR